MGEINDNTSKWLVPIILGVSCLFLIVIAYGLKNKWNLNYFVPSHNTIKEFSNVWEEYFVFRHFILYFIFTVCYFLMFSYTKQFNNDNAGKSTMNNLVDALYHSAVTQSTVGYGDISPIGPLGKFISVMHQFSSIYINLDFTSDILHETVTTIVKQENDNVRAAIQEQTKILKGLREIRSIVRS